MASAYCDNMASYNMLYSIEFHSFLLVHLQNTMKGTKTFTATSASLSFILRMSICAFLYLQQT